MYREDMILRSLNSIVKQFHITKLYSKVLFSFIIMVVVMVLSTSLIFSTMYIKNINKQLTIDSINNIDRLATDFDNTFKQIHNMSIYLSQVPDVNSFLYSTTLNDFLMVNRANMISRKVFSLNPYIHSLVLHNRDSSISLMSGNLNIDRNQFISKEVLRPDSISNMNLVFSEILSNHQGSDPIETLSILYSEGHNSTFFKDSSIFITIDRDAIEQKLLSKTRGTTVVVDRQGKVIFNSNNVEMIDSIFAEPYYLNIENLESTQGSYLYNTGNYKEIISYALSLQTGLYLINISNMDEYTTVITKSIITVISISFILLLAFLIVSFLLSRNIYSPIKRVTEVFSNSEYTEKNNLSGEIDKISNTFNNALQHIKKLELESDDYQKKLKVEFLRHLLQAEWTSDALMLEMKKFQFSIDFGKIILICLKIDNYHNIERNKKLAYENSLCSIIPEILNDTFSSETVNMYEGEIAILLSFKNNIQNNFNMLLGEMDKVRDIARNELKITLTIGIGGVSTNISDCISAYKKAIDMTNYRFILGNDVTIHSKLLEDILSQNETYCDEMENNLINAIKLNKRDDFINTLNEIFDFLKHNTYSDVTSTVFQIITVCIKTINQITIQDSYKYALKFNEFSKIFNSLETLEQAKLWLINLFDDYEKILESINYFKNNKYSDLVDDMIKYIQNNYADKNINVESLAQRAGYTPYYFSKIFREITKMNVTDYIKQTRIEKAKDLLNNMELNVGNIADMVGFSNVGYFYATFKKEVGFTPAVYRDYVLLKNAPGDNT